MNYIVESDIKGRMEGCDGGDWPLFDCVDEDLVAVREAEAGKAEYREVAML